MHAHVFTLQNQQQARGALTSPTQYACKHAAVLFSSRTSQRKPPSPSARRIECDAEGVDRACCKRKASPLQAIHNSRIAALHVPLLALRQLGALNVTLQPLRVFCSQAFRGPARKAENPSREALAETTCSKNKILLKTDDFVAPAAAGFCGPARKAENPSREALAETVCSKNKIPVKACDFLAPAAARLRGPARKAEKPSREALAETTCSKNKIPLKTCDFLAPAAARVRGPARKLENPSREALAETTCSKNKIPLKTCDFLAPAAAGLRGPARKAENPSREA